MLPIDQSEMSKLLDDNCCPVVVNECRPTEKLFGITRRPVEERVVAVFASLAQLIARGSRRDGRRCASSVYMRESGSISCEIALSSFDGDDHDDDIDDERTDGIETTASSMMVGLTDDCRYQSAITDDMTIFAEYHPCRVEIVDRTSCLMSFASRADCVRMMIGMTKPLRRFRATREAEDGELTDSDGEEEEGQIKLEKGDDVALVAHAVGFHLVLSCPDNRFGRSKETTPSKMIIFKREVMLDA
uniref:Proliferating cell nuclear antigen n=1 Tax=Angiostrongylus cantonensis TaxID=6313 RepID=A0A158P784_ANGCA